MESQGNSTFDDELDDRDANAELLDFCRSYLTNRRNVNVNVSVNDTDVNDDVDVENVAIPARCQALENIWRNVVGRNFPLFRNIILS